METTTWSELDWASDASCKWPECRAPMVGTRPIRGREDNVVEASDNPATRLAADQAFISFGVVNTAISFAGFEVNNRREENEEEGGARPSRVRDLAILGPASPDAELAARTIVAN